MNVRNSYGSVADDVVGVQQAAVEFSDAFAASVRQRNSSGRRVC